VSGVHGRVCVGCGGKWCALSSWDLALSSGTTHRNARDAAQFCVQPAHAPCTRQGATACPPGQAACQRRRAAHPTVGCETPPKMAPRLPYPVSVRVHTGCVYVCVCTHSRAATQPRAHAQLEAHTAGATHRQARGTHCDTHFPRPTTEAHTHAHPPPCWPSHPPPGSCALPPWPRSWGRRRGRGDPCRWRPCKKLLPPQRQSPRCTTAPAPCPRRAA